MKLFELGYFLKFLVLCLFMYLIIIDVKDKNYGIMNIREIFIIGIFFSFIGYFIKM